MGIVAMFRVVIEPILGGADRAFAVLLVTALLLSPLGWTYYFLLPVGPVAALARSWWVERPLDAGGDRALAGLASEYLFIMAMAGMAFPYFVVLLYQPSAVATVLIGSIPFWSLTFLWLALILDRLNARLIRDWLASMRIEWAKGRWVGRGIVSGAR
jgi:hypothetical protein